MRRARIPQSGVTLGPRAGGAAYSPAPRGKRVGMVEREYGSQPG
ncbi:acetyl-CoA carboxylase carboxyltransferase component [Streptomyces griseochromogenes]|uniref:Acetyl-CoA carboxylase carboxyltransferase component n=1 Tax=Streptomyces griseochromogenes TaxID=68214 RepID=A0ABS4LQV5_9ACTN|nr:hypothetical protein [Streptomyces griseochromogenes]MBP2049794.1 acetyl-CoA carboxylase carboxyltransferase component [Streptomyces griseochromogenes]